MAKAYFGIITLFLLAAVPAAEAAGSDTPPASATVTVILLGLLLAVLIWRLFKTRHELKSLHKLTDSMIDAMTSLVIGVDDKGKILEVNQSAAQFLGKAKADLIGKDFSEQFDEIPLKLDILSQIIKDAAPLHLNRVAGKDGSRIWDLHLTPWHSQRQPGAIIRLDDITEQVQLDGLMVQKEKLIIVSRLTVSMIHEINNPLASILQNMQVIHNRLGSQLQKNRIAAEECGTSLEKIDRYLQARGIDTALESVRESARRAARVIENLVNFTRQDDENEAFHSLSQLLECALELAGGDFNLKQKYDFRQIALERDYEKTLPPVRCRALKLQQAFFAMLRFRAEQMLEEEIPDPRMILRLSAEGDQALFRLEDNGPLLDEDARRNLFRPSVSAPESALGLCVCHFIICQIHGVTLSIENTEMGGSRIVVRIPIKREGR